MVYKPLCWTMNAVHGMVYHIPYTHLNMEFVSIYDVIKVHQVSGSPDYDVVMTE